MLHLLHLLTSHAHFHPCFLVQRGKIVLDQGFFGKKQDDTPELMKLYQLPLDFTDDTGRKTTSDGKINGES